MVKFDYRKWVTENKYGKITEQEVTATTTFYQTRTCGPCNNGNELYMISGSSYQGGIGSIFDNPIISNWDQNTTAGCNPLQLSNPVEVPNEIIPDNFGPYLTSNDIPGMFSGEFYETFGSQYLYPEDYTIPCAGDQIINDADTFSGVCCDSNASNYGQTNIPTLNVQFAQNGNYLDTALMLNQLEGTFCDNSICTGAAEPGDVPVDAMALAPDTEKTPLDFFNKFDKTKEKRLNRRK